MPKSVLFDREKVVEDVMKLFWKKGYNGTSMQDLVDVTGLNRSSLYNSFGDKFSLFQESLKHYQEVQQHYLHNFLTDSQSPKEAIESLFRGIGEEVSAGKSVNGCMISNCISELGNVDDRLKDFLVANKDQVVSTFHQLIVEAQKKGEIDPQKNARHLALYLFSSLNGIRITGMIDADVQGVTNQVIESL